MSISAFLIARSLTVAVAAAAAICKGMVAPTDGGGRGLGNAVGAAALEVCAGLLPNWGINRLEEIAASLGTKKSDIDRGIANSDLGRLIGRSVVTGFALTRREARADPGGRVIRQFLASEARLFAERWPTIDRSLIPAELRETSVGDFFVGEPSEIKAAPMLSPARWRLLLDAILGPTLIRESDDARSAVCEILHKNFAAILWETVKRAWRDRDLAWPALLLRLVSELSARMNSIEGGVLRVEASLASASDFILRLASLVEASLGQEQLAAQHQHLCAISNSAARIQRSLAALHRKLDSLAGVPRALMSIEQVLRECLPAGSLVAEAVTTIADLEPYEDIVGREADMEELMTLGLAPERRLLALVGPPCVGKSSLALNLVHRLSARLSCPGHKLDMILTDSSLEMANVVSAHFGARVSGSAQGSSQRNVQPTIAQLLRVRGPMVLLLDNCDACIEYIEETVRTWLRVAPLLRCVITSRREPDPPKPGDAVYRISPLLAPTSTASETWSLDELLAFPSVRLFINRARIVAPDFSPQGEDVRWVARVCQQTGGFPACIEIAAVLLESFSLLQIHRHLAETVFQVSDSAEEQVSRRFLYPALDSVLSTLKPAERLAFLQIAHFPGGLTLEAAQEVFLPTESASVAQTWRRLHKRNLVELQAHGVGGRRLESSRTALYQPIRIYALKLWLTVPLADRENHQKRTDEFFARFAEQQSQRLLSPEASAASTLLLEERENLIHLYSRALDRGDVSVALRLLLACEESFRLCGPAGQLRQLLEKVFATGLPLPAEVRPRLLRALSEAHWSLGDYNTARVHADEALALTTHLGVSRERAECVAWLGRVLVDQGDRDAARSLLEEARLMLCALGEYRALAAMSRNLANCLDWSGEFEEAMRVLLEGADAASRCNDHSGQARLVNARGLVLWHEGRPLEALKCFEEASQLFDTMKDVVWLAGSLTNCGLALTDLDRFDNAEQMFEAAGLLHMSQGNLAWKAVNAVGKVQLLLYRGLYEAAIDEVDRIRESVVGVSYPENIALMNLVGAVARLRSGDVAQARRELTAAHASLAKGSTRLLSYFLFCVSSASCCLKQGDAPGARRALLEAEPIARLRRVTRQHPVRFIRDLAHNAEAMAADLGVACPLFSTPESSGSPSKAQP